MNQVERDRVERVMTEAKRQIWVTWQREGIHMYPAAATDPNLADVSFLASPHRHIFHFRVWIDVFHNDRDVEFIQFKRWCESLYSSDNSVLSLDYKSCEMMADDLYTQIASRYPGRVIHIEVSEDGENGAMIRYELTKPNHNIVI
jgi:hypothetical protein